MKKSLAFLAIIAALSLCAGSAFAANLTLKVDSVAFNESDKQDIVGAGTSRNADGAVDASFNLSVSGAQAIKSITLKNETSGKTWSTSPSGSTELLLVKDSSGNILNSSSRMNVTPVLLAADFVLYVNDAAKAIPKDAKFTVTITMIDGKNVTGTTTVKAQGTQQTPAPTQPIAPGKVSGKNEIILFESNGVGAQDLAGDNEKIGGDGKGDYEFSLKFAFKDTTVKGMKLTATAGSKKAEWDTVPGNKTPLALLIDGGKNIVNKADGSVSFAGKSEAGYLLLVSDKNGILSEPNVKTKLVVTLGDGSMLEKDAIKGKKILGKDSAEAVYDGVGKYDFVGQGKKLEANMTPDRFIHVTLNATGTLTGVKIKDVVTGHAWDTVPSSKNPLVAVMGIKGEKYNKGDGAISVEVKGATEFNLAFDEENEKAKGPYQVTMVFASGQLIEVSTGKATSTSDQPATAAERGVKFVSAKPAIAAVDVVGKNKKRASNSAKDTTLSVQISGSGNIKAMALTNSAGKGWDTLSANNGRWLLGVRDSAGKTLNAKNGTVKIAVNGTKKFQLLMQDDGTLKAKSGKLLLTTTWGDGEVTETEYKW